MNQLIQTLSAMDDVISFGTDLSGSILAASKPAVKVHPACIGMPLQAVLPQYFDPKFPPDFAAFDYHHTLRAKNGGRLDISRFGDTLLCRELPAEDIPFDLTQLPEQVRAASLEQIRASIEKAIRSHSVIEDVFSDLDFYSRKDYQTVTDTLRDSNMSCRKVYLACNRLEMAEAFSPDRYPPQRVVLTEALWELVHSIRVELPELAMPVREELPPYPVAVRANWELLRRAVLEIIRHSAAAAAKREGSTVFGIELLEQKDTCTIRLSDNYSGMLSPDGEQQGEESPARIYRYIERIMAYFGGSIVSTKTDFGDNALDLILPLQPDSYKTDLPFTLYAGNSYKSYEEQNLSAPLVYLEDFSK